MIKPLQKNKERLRRHRRIREKISGTATCPRLSVYRSNKHIFVQLIDDVNHRTLFASSTIELKIAKGNDISAAEKVGKDIAEKALKADIKNVVFDRSGYLYHGRIKALAEASRAAGLQF
jgi:large subunit ribosomal protein L18